VSEPYALAGEPEGERIAPAKIPTSALPRLTRDQVFGATAAPPWLKEALDGGIPDQVYRDARLEWSITDELRRGVE
jgi:hypothetical protein